MSFQTHPTVITAYAEQRHAEYLAEVDRERIAKRAVSTGGALARQQATHRRVVGAAIIGLALALGFGSASHVESPGANAGAVQKVREAAP